MDDRFTGSFADYIFTYRKLSCLNGIPEILPVACIKRPGKGHAQGKDVPLTVEADDRYILGILLDKFREKLTACRYITRPDLGKSGKSKQQLPGAGSDRFLFCGDHIDQCRRFLPRFCYLMVSPFQAVIQDDTEGRDEGE